MSHPEARRFSAPLPPQVAFMQMMTAHWVSRTLYVAAKLGIADLLKDGAMSCAELATSTQTNAD